MTRRPGPDSIRRPCSRSFPRPSVLVPWLAALLAGALAGCGGDGHDSIRASGQVEATEVRVASKVPGVLRDLKVQEGDRVRAGQVLAVIDTVDLVLSRDAARADRDQARAALDLAVAGSRREDVAAARAEVDRRRADLDGAQRDFTRAQSLLDTGTGSEKGRDDARVRRDMAQAALTSAEETLAKLVAGSRPEEIAAQRAAYSRAEARLASLEQQVRDAVIRAPLDGEVTAKLSEAGEFVAVGGGIVVVDDLARPWLTVFVSGADLPRIRLGQRATVTSDAAGDRGREGTVSYISPVAEFTPRNVQTRDERARLVYRVRIRLDNPDGRFKPGMPADAVLHAAAATAPGATPGAGR